MAQGTPTSAARQVLSLFLPFPQELSLGPMAFPAHGKQMPSSGGTGGVETAPAGHLEAQYHCVTLGTSLLPLGPGDERVGPPDQAICDLVAHLCLLSSQGITSVPQITRTGACVAPAFHPLVRHPDPGQDAFHSPSWASL